MKEQADELEPRGQFIGGNFRTMIFELAETSIWRTTSLDHTGH